MSFRRRLDAGGGLIRVGTAAMITALLMIAASSPVLGYQDEASWDAARQLDRFLDDHPWVARDLQRDPTLVNDRRYLEDHRSLSEFLGGHPEVRRELERDPHAVLRREHRVAREERRGREIGRDEMERFDRFLRDHPAVAHDLRGDPTLVNSRGWLGDHPSFRDFLRDHPTIRQELQDNPYASLRRWERFVDRADRPRKPDERRRSGGR
jgi:hypothetical protein